jgi:hypothetical protein
VIHHHTSGTTEPHAKSLGGRRGKSQRASDDQGMPICNAHHAQLHDLRGYFADFDKHSLRGWQDEQVDRLTRLYGMAHPAPIAHVSVGGVAVKASSGRPDATTRERLRIASWLRDKAGARHLKINEAAVLTDAASELEQQTGEF